MGVAIFFVLAAAVVGVLVFPLLPGRQPSPEAPALTDGDIEQLVENLRRARGREGLYCPTCGAEYRAADRYCGRCGGALPQEQADSTGHTCPSCGVGVREGDLFCARCGHSLAVEEAA